MDPGTIRVFQDEPPVNTVDLGNEPLDCEHIEDLTERWVDPDRPSFVTVLFRFFGNIFVDCFRAIFA